MNEHDFLSLDAVRITEYLIAAVYLALFIPLWGFLSRPPLVRIVRNAEKPVLDWFTVPQGFFLHPGHAWAKAERDGFVKVGLDDFGHNLIGPVEKIELPDPGKKVKQGERAFRLHVDGKTFDVLAPVDGRVAEINMKAIEQPAEMGADPYGTSWLMKVVPDRLSMNLHSLLAGEAARVFIEKALDQLVYNPKNPLTPAWQHAYAQDGGVPVAGLAKELSPDRWDELIRKQLLDMAPAEA